MITLLHIYSCSITRFTPHQQAREGMVNAGHSIQLVRTGGHKKSPKFPAIDSTGLTDWRGTEKLKDMSCSGLEHPTQAKDNFGLRSGGSLVKSLDHFMSEWEPSELGHGVLARFFLSLSLRICL